MGEGKKVATERICLGSAGNRKKEKGRAMGGMIMGMRKGIERGKEKSQGKEERLMTETVNLGKSGGG